MLFLTSVYLAAPFTPHGRRPPTRNEKNLIKEKQKSKTIADI